MKTKLLLISMALSLISISGCSYIPVRTPFTISGNNYKIDSINSDTLRILNWNIHKEVDNDNWKNDFIKIVKSDKKPTIILLQEVRLEENIIDIFKNDLRMGWEFCPNLYQEKYDAYSGVLTASYIKPTMVESALSNGTEPFTKTPKPILFTKYNIGSKSSELLIVNIHGINFKINLDEFKEQIRFVAGAIMQHNGPVIMAGDFNTWRKDRIEHLNKIANELNMEKIAVCNFPHVPPISNLVSCPHSIEVWRLQNAIQG